MRHTYASLKIMLLDLQGISVTPNKKQIANFLSVLSC